LPGREDDSSVGFTPTKSIRRTTMKSRISTNQLKACDVLLYHGASPLGSLIRLLDGSQYSHASIWDGDCVTEAVASGIEHRDLKTSVAGAEFVDVYRFRSKEGICLGEAGLEADPVLKRIHFYQENPERYAYEELLLLAVLCVTRRVPSVMIRWILDSAAAAVEALIAAGKEPMICSELVYRCFEEAGNQYSPKIIGAERQAILYGAPQPAGEDLSFLAGYDLRSGIEGYMEQLALAKQMDSRMLLDFNKPNPNFITPGDLRKSPNLVLQGTLTL
jgi:hypothetical protein